MEHQEVIKAAQKTFVALQNPYGSVEKVYPMILKEWGKGDSYHYLGVKNKIQIPRSLIKLLGEKGNYLLHTLDKASFGGRAVDVTLTNPISGKPMTGSSSGTAINVLLGINDLGIGTDGGGSVLAPAMSLNLFGFISCLIETEYVKTFSSTSTDGIDFSISLGFITREYEEIVHAINIALNFSEVELIKNPNIFTLSTAISKRFKQAKMIKSPDIYDNREPLIHFLTETLPQCDFLISEEGPVDFSGFGDTVLGHLGELAGNRQKASGKGLIRVANMADATALVIPKKDFGCGYVLLCESSLDKIKTMLEFAKILSIPQDPLLKKYFQDGENYFPEEFQ